MRNQVVKGQENLTSPRPRALEGSAFRLVIASTFPTDRNGNYEMFVVADSMELAVRLVSKELPDDKKIKSCDEIVSHLTVYTELMNDVDTIQSE